MNLSIIGQVLRVLVGYNKSLGTKVIMGILLILTGTGIYSLFTGYPNMEVIMSLIKIVTDVLFQTGSQLSSGVMVKYLQTSPLPCKTPKDTYMMSI